jgi:hypothetical protein
MLQEDKKGEKEGIPTCPLCDPDGDKALKSKSNNGI